MKSTIQNPNNVPVIGISQHRMETDGQGITTLVAFHACPLNCKYCLNPQCHESEENFPHYTPEQLYEEVKVDDLYFRATGGGITFGGGEPLLRADFIENFRNLCGKDWKITIETSLYGDYTDIQNLAPIVDEWIIDVKTDNEYKYRQYTSKPFDQIYQNIHTLLSQPNLNKDHILLRIPFIPGLTDDSDVEATKRKFESDGFTRFDIFTYSTEQPPKETAASYRLEGGKAKCKILKSIRKEIAKNNNIELDERECTHQDDCPGTCPKCEADVQALNLALIEKGVNDIRVSDKLIRRMDCSLYSDTEDKQKHVLMGEPIPLSAGFVSFDDYKHDRDIKAEKTKVFFKECAIAGVSFHLKKMTNFGTNSV